MVSCCYRQFDCCLHIIWVQSQYRPISCTSPILIGNHLDGIRASEMQVPTVPAAPHTACIVWVMWSLTGSLDPAAPPCRIGRQQTYTHLADTSCLLCEKSPGMCRELYQVGSGLTARTQPAPVPELPSLLRVPCRVLVNIWNSGGALHLGSEAGGLANGRFSCAMMGSTLCGCATEGPRGT